MNMPTVMKLPPWKCGSCRERAVVPVVIPYEAKVEHDGRTYTLTFADLRVLRCERCGTIVLDDAANQRISQALRRQAGLLTPEEILTHRQSLGLTQKQLAGYLGIAESTLSRWETGIQIQQRSLDRFLRVFSRFPSVRAVLAREPVVASVASPGTAEASAVFRCLETTPVVLARARQFQLRRVRPEPVMGTNTAFTPSETETAAVS